MTPRPERETMICLRCGKPGALDLDTGGAYHANLAECAKHALPAPGGAVGEEVERALENYSVAAMRFALKCDDDNNEAANAARETLRAALAAQTRRAVEQGRGEARMSCVNWLRHYASRARKLNLNMPVDVATEADFLADQLAALADDEGRGRDERRTGVAVEGCGVC